MRKYRSTLHLIYNSQEVLFDRLSSDCEGLYIAPRGNLVFESKFPIDKMVVKELLKSFVSTEANIYEGSDLLMKTVLVTSFIIFITSPLSTEHILSSEPIDFLPDGHKVYPKTKIISNRHRLLVDTGKKQYYKDVEKIFNITYDFRRNDK